MDSAVSNIRCERGADEKESMREMIGGVKNMYIGGTVTEAEIRDLLLYNGSFWIQLHLETNLK